MRKYIITLFLCFVAAPAWAQCNGVFGANSLCGSGAGGIATELSLSVTALTFGQTVTITTPNQTNIQGYNVLQTGLSSSFNPGSNVQFFWNKIEVDNDNIDINPTNIHSSALEIKHNVGANSGGSKYGIAVTEIQQATATNADGDHIGGSFISLGQMPAGTVGGSHGSLYGLQAQAFAQLSGSTNWLIISGGEFDSDTASGTSVLNRFGTDIVDGGAVQGSVRDAAIELGGSGALGFKMGIMLSQLHGANPLSSTATLIGTDGLITLTIANGIDLRGGGLLTITNCAYCSSGFSVNGTGSVTAATLQSSGAVTLNLSVGDIGLQKISASNTGPGAGAMKLETVAGTNAGSCKLIAYAGTSSTPVTVVDNVGSGC